MTEGHNALKTAIKQGTTTHIVDGGDMTDHGWMLQREHNLVLAGLRKALHAARARIVHLDAAQHSSYASTATLKIIDAALAL